MTDQPAKDPVKCQSCPQVIVFASARKRAGGKPAWMPLNAAPDPAGNVAVAVQAGVLVGRVVRKGEPLADGEQLYCPHWVTCTGASAHRKRQRDQLATARRDHAAAQRRGRARPAQPDVLPGMVRLWPGGTDEKGGETS